MKSVKQVVLDKLMANDPRGEFQYDRDFYYEDAGNIARKISRYSTIDEITEALYDTFPGFYPPEEYKEGFLEGIASNIYDEFQRSLIKKKENKYMTNKELTQIRESLSLTKKEFAEKIGATAMMVGRYEKGSSIIPDNVATAAKALVEPAAEEDITALVKLARESLNVSKSAFAKLIGVSATMAGNYESGKSKPKDEILEKIKSLIENSTQAAPSAPVDEKEEAAPAPVDEKKEEPAPVDEKEAASAPAEEKSEEPAPKKRKSAPAKKKAEKPAPVDEEKAEEKSSAPAAAPVDERKTVSIFIESKMGGNITTEEVLSRLPDGVDTVYVKPEENAAYWVKGSESGVVNLW